MYKKKHLMMMKNFDRGSKSVYLKISMWFLKYVCLKLHELNHNIQLPWNLDAQNPDK